MKKSIIIVAVLLGSFPVMAVASSVNVQSNQITILQEEFKEIGLDAVPTAVKSSVETSFPGAKLVKAYAKEDAKEYKLDLMMGDKSYTIFTDAEGKIIKK